MDVSVINGGNLVSLQVVGGILLVVGLLLCLVFGAFLTSLTENDLKKVRSDILCGRVLGSFFAVIAVAGAGLMAFAFQQYGYGKGWETLGDGTYRLEVAFGEVPNSKGTTGTVYHLVVWARGSETVKDFTKVQRSVKLPADAYVTLDGKQLSRPEDLAGKYVSGTLVVSTEVLDSVESKGGHEWKLSTAKTGKVKKYNIKTLQ